MWEDPVALLTFADFRAKVVVLLQSLPGAQVDSDKWIVSFTDSQGNTGTARFDFLYRVYIDASAQGPNAPDSDLMVAVRAAIDECRKQFNVPPIFQVTQLPASLSGLVMRQRCVRPCVVD